MCTIVRNQRLKFEKTIRRKTDQIPMTYEKTLIKNMLRSRVELDITTQSHKPKKISINVIMMKTRVINTRKTLKLLLRYWCCSLLFSKGGREKQISKFGKVANRKFLISLFDQRYILTEVVKNINFSLVLLNINWHRKNKTKDMIFSAKLKALRNCVLCILRA